MEIGLNCAQNVAVFWAHLRTVRKKAKHWISHAITVCFRTLRNSTKSLLRVCASFLFYIFLPTFVSVCWPLLCVDQETGLNMA